MSQRPRSAGRRAQPRLVRTDRIPGVDPAVTELVEQLRTVGVPADVLDVVSRAASPEAALTELVSSGLLPSPGDTLAMMLDQWQPLLRTGTDPLTAEMCGAEFLAALRTTTPNEAELAGLLTALLTAAEHLASPEALAMHQVLAVVGDGEIRARAAAGAERLVAAGLKDRPWVRGLGSLTVEGVFGYSHPHGTQDSLVVAFRYGRRAHMISVLIDYGLGGGVKDCYVGKDPVQTRAEYERIAKRNGANVRDIPLPEATQILERALAMRPCPVEPDQIEDVHTYLDLLRRRLPLLRSATPTPRSRTSTVHRIKITLAGSKPPIWRRLEVRSTTTLEELHNDIQAAFGWDGYHMWVFSTGHAEYGIPDPELGFGNAATMTLRRAAPHPADKLRYTYDFGDDWEHVIVVEAVSSEESEISYPRCLTGRRARPPEDCGGMWSYAVLLEVLADPAHPDHGERLEWLGLESADDFDPAAFDVEEINAALAAPTSD